MPGLDKLVAIKLDKERHLRLTLKGMIAFRNLTDINLLEGFNLAELTLEQTGALLYACLLHEDKELTYDDVLNMIDLSNITRISEALEASAEQSLTPPEEEDTPDPLP